MNIFQPFRSLRARRRTVVGDRARHIRRRRVAKAAALTLAVCTGMAACSAGGSVTPVAVSPSASPAPVPVELESFYGQSLSWYPCGEGDSITKVSDGSFMCATASVPLDYSNPTGQTVEIAMKKRPAGGKSIGTLFVNPGGPGGSGVEIVDHVEGFFSQALLNSYDVIGFDPRGVGASTAVDCFTDAQLDADRAGDDQSSLSSFTDAAQAEAAVTAYATSVKEACEANTQPVELLDHIDTVSVARDLDILRALSGSQALTYLGYSYGTYLGATYAQLFPTQVGRMVLDGAIDPTLTAAQLTLGQAKGFEASLRAFVTYCLGDDSCPLQGSVDEGVEQIRQFLDGTRTSPIPTANAARSLTYDLAEDAIIGALYQDEAWNVLREGLHQAMIQHDGSTMLYIADVLASRNSDGTYSGNGNEAIAPINCLDYPVTGDSQTWAQEQEELTQASPTFGADLGYVDLYCQTWGHTSTREHTPVHATGAPPIMVIGTTGDPATPYEWSKALASQLDSGHLVTWKGEGHTAYGRAGSCITKAVDNYLLAGTLPEEGLTCQGKN